MGSWKTTCLLLLRKFLMIVPVLAIVAALFKLSREVRLFSPNTRQMVSSTGGWKATHSGKTGVNWKNSSKQPTLNLDQYFISLTNYRILSEFSGLDLYIHRAFQDDRFHDTYFRVFGIEKEDSIVKDGWKCRWTVVEGGVAVTKEVKAKKYFIDAKRPANTTHVANNFDCHLPGRLKSKIDSLMLVDGEDRSLEVPLERTVKLSPRRGLAVCVGPLVDRVEVARLVEWVEIQQVIGIRHFIVYDAELQGSARFVLDYYQSQGLVTIVSFPFMAAVLNKLSTLNDHHHREAVIHQVNLLARTDCLYRFHGSYTYLQMTSLNEVILPTTDDDWPAMIHDLHATYPHAAGFVFSAAYHFEESFRRTAYPDQAWGYLYMQKYRMALPPTRDEVRSVVVSKQALSLNKRRVLDVPSKTYSNVEPSWQAYGYVHHFPGTCADTLGTEECETLLPTAHMDQVVPKYRDRVRLRAQKALGHLQL